MTTKHLDSKMFSLLLLVMLSAASTFWLHHHINIPKTANGSNTNADTVVTVITNFWDPLNSTKCAGDTSNNCKVIAGLTIPTTHRKKWFAHGFGVNCSKQKWSDYTNDIINFSMWRADGLGQKLFNAMEFIAISLSNPAKYHFYYFPFIARHAYLTGEWQDLRAIEKFINFGYNERNIFSQPCQCCVWGPKIKEIIPKMTSNHKLFNETVLTYFRHKYWQNKGDLTNMYNASSDNVAVHIRRGDVLDDSLKGRLLSDAYFVKIMKYIYYKLRNDTDHRIYFHIFSQHNFDRNNFENAISNHFGSNDTQSLQLKYYLNTPLNMTFHGMVTANFAFIGSVSSLSQTAAMLSATKYVFMPVKRRTLPHWIACNPNTKCMYPNDAKLQWLSSMDPNRM